MPGGRARGGNFGAVRFRAEIEFLLSRWERSALAGFGFYFPEPC